MKGFTHFVVLAMFAVYAQGFIYEKKPGKQSELCQKYLEFTQTIAKGLSIRENSKVVYPQKSRRYLAYSCDSIYEAFLSLGENSTIFNFKKKKLTVVYRTCSTMAKLKSGAYKETDANLKNVSSVQNVVKKLVCARWLGDWLTSKLRLSSMYEFT
ncbi:unnamed protein product [Cylicocyclus nassatus]|uniref:Uncharacterized protein n=1 Tax=Cylicocyclus nassatus TaxID=53992 RepID=A0AA36DMK3_CYLNA|nr:unnamed protein product [Cylicocyclus nassatus]